MGGDLELYNRARRLLAHVLDSLLHEGVSVRVRVRVSESGSVRESVRE